MRRVSSRKVAGWWKTSSLSVAASAAIHLTAGVAVVLLAGRQIDRPASPPARWGIIEVTQATRLAERRPVTPPLKRPDLPLRPIPVRTPSPVWEDPAPPPRPVTVPPRQPHPEPPPSRPPPIRTEPSPSTPEASTTSPEAIDNPPPEYPEVAVKRGYQGVVVILARISVEGSPVEVTLERSSGYRLLDRAARKAVLRWKFHPGTRNGRPVESEVEIPIRFTID